MKKKILIFLLSGLFLVGVLKPSSAFACGTAGTQCCVGSGIRPCDNTSSCQAGICLSNTSPTNNNSNNNTNTNTNTGTTTGTNQTSPGLMCDNGNGIQTAIGCINVLGSQEQFLGDILRWAVGVGGGIAFLLILYASFMVMTSAGDPERLKAGQELLTSAISGLILLIFSVFILQFIGLDILGLGKLGFSPL